MDFFNFVIALYHYHNTDINLKFEIKKTNYKAYKPHKPHQQTVFTYFVTLHNLASKQFHQWLVLSTTMCVYMILQIY